MKKTISGRSGPLWIFLPVILYLGSLGAARWVGYQSLTIPWNHWQLLDRELLLAKPWESILYLHAQPPLFNSLLAAVLWTAEKTLLSPETAGMVLYVVVGLASAVLFYDLLHQRTGKHGYAVLGTALLFFNPSTWYYQHQFYYPFLLAFFFILLLRSLEKVINHQNSNTGPRQGTLFLAVLLFTLTRTLYHPFWAVGLLGLVFLLQWWISEEQFLKFISPSYALYAAAVLAVFLVPLKNKVVFDQFTTTSWTGFNLSRGTKIARETLADYRDQGTVPATIQESLTAFERSRGLKEPNVLSEARKSTGGRNWNHYLLLEVNQELTRKAMNYRLENPLTWMKQAIYHYLTWSKMPIINTYTDQLRGPSAVRYVRTSAFFQSLFYHDVRPTLNHLSLVSIDWPTFILFREEAVYPLFGVFYFPALMILSGLTLWKKITRKEKKTAAFLAVVVYNIGWVLLVPILTDGFESNRMRYAIFPLLITLGISIIHHFSPDTQALFQDDRS